MKKSGKTWAYPQKIKSSPFPSTPESSKFSTLQTENRNFLWFFVPIRIYWSSQILWFDFFSCETASLSLPIGSLRSSFLPSFFPYSLPPPLPFLQSVLYLEFGFPLPVYIWKTHSCRSKAFTAHAKGLVALCKGHRAYLIRRKATQNKKIWLSNLMKSYWINIACPCQAIWRHLK